MDQEKIAVRTRYFAGNDASQPGIVVQITALRGSYMIWAGTSANGEQGEVSVSEGHLARDWACAMPPGQVPLGPSLFRSTTRDAALSMACRLSKRLNAQVFVSLDVESRLEMLAEKRIVESLKES
ncbi:hypothetical protein B0H15DRAFT_788222 [Mycena belliarum]|uniref:Uncharacterized protein n=1 Tax=Mycena belliarum TaxID=1033014 RepID=A0AAD6TVU0_9AGAR|nr:hypothetical protein B0H15DRAFT_788222 [Mycena belliae]